MKVVAVYSVKGGVGKTTTAVQLAALAAQDLRVLLWDLDPQGGAAWLLGVDPTAQRRDKAPESATYVATGEGKLRHAVVHTRFGPDVLPPDGSNRDLDAVLATAKRGDKRLAEALEPLAAHYDLVILDSPPGASALADAVVRAADVVVTPLVPAALTLRSLEQVRTVLAESRRPPGLVAFLTMVDARKTAHREALTALPASEREVTDVAVPASVVVERMGEQRAPLGVVAPRSAAAREYARLWQGVRRALGLAAAGVVTDGDAGAARSATRGKDAKAPKDAKDARHRARRA